MRPGRKAPEEHNQQYKKAKGGVSKLTHPLLNGNISVCKANT